MDWCVQHGRALCTKNEVDFRREHRRRIAAGQDHFGIITIPDWPTALIFRALEAFLARTEDVDLLNALVALPDP